MTNHSQVPIKQKSEHYQVIVIGAGTAGLAAARELNKNGYDVLVLEARDRIGGRIWTLRDTNDVALDMGAGWIHGISKNPIHHIAQQLSLPLSHTNYRNAQLFGEGESQPKCCDSRWTSLESAMYQSIRESSSSTIDNALGQLREFKKRGDFTKDEIEFFINTTLEHEYAANVSTLSVDAIDEGEGFSGPDAMFEEGFDQVIDFLAEDVDVLLEKTVTKINYANEKVEITIGRGELLTAGSVIVTVPLGVLKNNSIEFTPSLGKERSLAIESLGMGLLNRLYLEFSETFWNSEIERFGFIPKERGRWCEWYNMLSVTKKPILLGFVAGSYAEKMELSSEEEVVEDAMDALRSMFGEHIPQPERAFSTNWRADPYACGSYSYLSSGSSSDMRKHIAKPLHNKVFFAGEAMDIDNPATVHGALHSGLLAAKRIHGHVIK